MNPMGVIMWALVITAQVPDGENQTAAVFTTREECMQEAKRVIEQGPSAYCVPTNVSTQAQVEEQMRSVFRLMGNMMREMNDVPRY